MLSAVAACSGQDAVRREASGVVACSSVQIPVRVGTDSLSSRACDFVSRAIAAIDSGDGAPAGTPEVSPANYREASVDAVAETNEQGAILTAWWTTTLRTRDRPYDIEVRINQRTGEPVVRPVHK